ncbi:MAG: sensor histidine kinase [Deltaproteobacteria bacterium]|nr:sensor histidine kinase [Deltaproteobacteria bacterium]
MTPAERALAIGDRYRELGLPAAAGAAYRRAGLLDPAPGVASRRLAELALAEGDGAAAKRHADDASRRQPGPSTRLLVGRAALAAGELAAARFAFTAVVEGAARDARLRAEAHIGRAEVALAEGDSAGGFAHLAAAVDDHPDDADVIARVGTLAVATGRAAELLARTREEVTSRPQSHSAQAIHAEVLAAAQAAGAAPVADAEIEQALERTLTLDPRDHGARLKLGLRLLRRRFRDTGARQRALVELERLAAELGAGPARARVDLLLAGLYDDDEATATAAAAAAERALDARPGDAAALGTLGMLALRRDDLPRARARLLAAVGRAPRDDGAYHTLARLLYAERATRTLADDVGAVLGAAVPALGEAAVDAGDAAARLLHALTEVARADVYEGLYTKGHQLKNLLGIAGARARSAVKAARAAGAAPDLLAKHEELTSHIGALYDEWASYLRTMKDDSPRLEAVAVNGLAAEAAQLAAQRGGGAPVRLVPGGAMPEIRGDRARLREALLNLVANALEAQAEVDPSAAVEVATRALPGASGAAPRVEIEIRDRGPGIARADLRRIFAPGFTTKEGGSGFGLAIAERVVAAHHGRIAIDSEPGRGTTVRIDLPSDLEGLAAVPRVSS